MKTKPTHGTKETFQNETIFILLIKGRIFSSVILISLAFRINRVPSFAVTYSKTSISLGMVPKIQLKEIEIAFQEYENKNK